MLHCWMLRTEQFAIAGMCMLIRVVIKYDYIPFPLWKSDIIRLWGHKVKIIVMHIHITHHSHDTNGVTSTNWLHIHYIDRTWVKEKSSDYRVVRSKVQIQSQGHRYASQYFCVTRYVKYIFSVDFVITT